MFTNLMCCSTDLIRLLYWRSLLENTLTARKHSFSLLEEIFSQHKLSQGNSWYFRPFSWVEASKATYVYVPILKFTSYSNVYCMKMSYGCQVHIAWEKNSYKLFFILKFFDISILYWFDSKQTLVQISYGLLKV